MDIMEPVKNSFTPKIPLAKALADMKHLDVEYIPVTSASGSYDFKGILDSKSVHRQIAAQVLAKQKEADSKYGLMAS